MWNWLKCEMQLNVKRTREIKNTKQILPPPLFFFKGDKLEWPLCTLYKLYNLGGLLHTLYRLYNLSSWKSKRAVHRCTHWVSNRATEWATAANLQCGEDSLIVVEPQFCWYIKVVSEHQLYEISVDSFYKSVRLFACS